MKKITLWMRRYVTIYGIIMLCTFFMCLLFNPTSELPVVTFFGRMVLTRWWKTHWPDASDSF